MEKELNSLDGDLGKMKSSKSMWILKIFMPGIYARIMGVSNISKNVTGIGLIKKLQTQIFALEAHKKALQTAEGGAVLIDAARTTYSVVAAGFAMYIIPGLLLLLASPIIIAALSIIYFLTKKGILTKAVDDLVKQLDQRLKKLKEKLNLEKKKLSLRRNIKQKYNELSQTGMMERSQKNDENQDAPEQGANQQQN